VVTRAPAEGNPLDAEGAMDSFLPSSFTGDMNSANDLRKCSKTSPWDKSCYCGDNSVLTLGEFLDATPCTSIGTSPWEQPLARHLVSIGATRGASIGSNPGEHWDDTIDEFLNGTPRTSIGGASFTADPLDESLELEAATVREATAAPAKASPACPAVFGMSFIPAAAEFKYLNVAATSRQVSKSSFVSVSSCMSASSNACTLDEFLGSAPGTSTASFNSASSSFASTVVLPNLLQERRMSKQSCAASSNGCPTPRRVHFADEDGGELEDVSEIPSGKAEKHGKKDKKQSRVEKIISKFMSERDHDGVTAEGQGPGVSSRTAMVGFALAAIALV
jgi:hypothetical protein